MFEVTTAWPRRPNFFTYWARTTARKCSVSILFASRNPETRKKAEGSGPGTGFLADVCRGWEAEADRARDFGLRVIKMRVGFVLGKVGGALAQMLPVFRAGVGGRLGSGRQWMPWIHVDDVAELFTFAIKNDVSGVWNAASPGPVRNSDFTAQLAAATHRPALIPAPRFLLKLVFGELAQHMLDSARVVPDGPVKAGFRFRFPELGPALVDLAR